MYPQHHLVYGIIFATALFFLFPAIGWLGFFIIILSTILIDVDHYIDYAVRKKDWSLKNSFKWHINIGKKLLSFPRKQRNNIYLGLCFLHGIEILLIFLFLGIFVSKYFLFVFIGLSFHLLLDAIHQTTYWDRIDKFSLLGDYLKFKKLDNVEN